MNYILLVSILLLIIILLVKKIYSKELSDDALIAIFKGIMYSGAFLFIAAIGITIADYVELKNNGVETFGEITSARIEQKHSYSSADKRHSYKSVCIVEYIFLKNGRVQNGNEIMKDYQCNRLAKGSKVKIKYASNNPNNSKIVYIFPKE